MAQHALRCTMRSYSILYACAESGKWARRAGAVQSPLDENGEPTLTTAAGRLVLTPSNAEGILARWLGASVRCTSVERLHGGMINSVFALSFDKPPHACVIKLSGDAGSPFAAEVRSLRVLKEVARLPVPEVYATAQARSAHEPAYLLLERLRGVPLGEARLTPDRRAEVEDHLAGILLQLHSHTRDTYGPVGDGGFERWADWFCPVFEASLRDAAPRLAPATRDAALAILARSPEALAASGPPTLVHGDVWENNVMVAPEPEGWRVTGLLDPGAMYADVEFELAYVEVFGTGSAPFFGRYRAERPMRPGYERRRLIYWLHTMLVHVAVFGDRHYVERAATIVQELERACLLR